MNHGILKPLDQDLTLQKELWTVAAARETQSPPRKFHPRPAVFPEQPNLADALEERGKALRVFEEESARRKWDGANDQVVHARGLQENPCDDFKPYEEPLRPAIGSGYQCSTCFWPRATLPERFGKNKIRIKSIDEAELEADRYVSRQDRIKALEEAMLAHEEDRFRRIGVGTAPLMNADGKVQPVLSLGETDADLGKQLRRRKLQKQGFAPYLAASTALHEQWEKRTVPDILSTEQILGNAARDDAVLYRDHKIYGNCQTGSDPLVATSPRAQNSWRSHMSQNYQELLQDAEHAAQDPSSKQVEYWTSFCMQMCINAYDSPISDVIRMVRVIGLAAHSIYMKSIKSELVRAAEHLLGSLSSRLSQTDLDFLAELAEVMCDAKVGNQIYLDALMAHVLSCHHRDCRALSMKRAARLSSALSRLEQTMRLRPRGVGGASTTTNWRVMAILEQRLYQCAPEAAIEDLICLDGYYLARFCGRDTQKAILLRVAELELGFRSASEQHLPMVMQLCEGLQRELGDTFRYTLPYGARDYFERVHEMALGKKAPWTARSRQFA